VSQTDDNAELDQLSESTQYPDVRDLDLEPLAHFCRVGRASRQFRRLMHPERDSPLVHHLRAEYR
jgi:hypothetical protein